MAKTVLVTFDVDGTLIKSVGADANKFHKDAFVHAFKEVYGIDTNIDVIHHHGCTDRQVARRTLVHNGLTEAAINEKLGDCMDAMIRYAQAHHDIAKVGIEVLPGVAKLLEELSKRQDSVTVALVTGNLQPIGWVKMEALGLRPFFTSPGFGGFGSDHEERGELVLIAAQRPHSSHWHVGDTPADISAAEYGGARALGVCTGARPGPACPSALAPAGVYKDADLRAASKDPENVVILPDLTDTEAVLKLFLGA